MKKIFEVDVPLGCEGYVGLNDYMDTHGICPESRYPRVSIKDCNGWTEIFQCKGELYVARHEFVGGSLYTTTKEEALELLSNEGISCFNLSMKVDVVLDGIAND